MIKEFAERHRLKTKRSADDDGEIVINGRSGQIYEYSDTELAVSFTPGLDKERRGIGKWCPKKWNATRKAAEAVGMIVRQNGDTEGSLSFDPKNKAQCKMAMQIAKVKLKRQLSDSQRAAVASRLAAARSAKTAR